MGNHQFYFCEGSVKGSGDFGSWQHCSVQWKVQLHCETGAAHICWILSLSSPSLNILSVAATTRLKLNSKEHLLPFLQPFRQAKCFASVPRRRYRKDQARFEGRNATSRWNHVVHFVCKKFQNPFRRMKVCWCSWVNQSDTKKSFREDSDRFCTHVALQSAVSIFKAPHNQSGLGCLPRYRALWKRRGPTERP